MINAVFSEGAVPLYQEPICKFAAYSWHHRKFLTGASLFNNVFVLVNYYF
jgi:hypothetical protein